MININYYDKNGKQVARDIMMTGKLSTELLMLTYEKCILLEYYSYIADDGDGNHIKEVVLKDEENCAEQMTTEDSSNYEVHNKQTRKAGGKCRPVAQYTKDGNLVAVWSSVIEAGRHTGASNICDAAHGKLRTSGGYVWKYVEDDKEC